MTRTGRYEIYVRGASTHAISPDAASDPRRLGVMSDEVRVEKGSTKVGSGGERHHARSSEPFDANGQLCFVGN